jgi:subtilisin family serine protease
VTCVAGVVINKERIGYSTKGPGRLEKSKPDIASFTHFAGSGVYAADGGTSAATPVAAGVVAAIRRLYPSSVLPPAQLRDLLRNTAERRGNRRFDYEYGYGVIDVQGLLEALEASTAGQRTVLQPRRTAARRARAVAKGARTRARRG